VHIVVDGNGDYVQLDGSKNPISDHGPASLLPGVAL